MMKLTLSISRLFILCALCIWGCGPVTFITGYDEIIDSTATKIKMEFNKHFIKLQRTLRDNDPENQKFENFQEYYDNMEVDLLMLKDRLKFLSEKSEVIRKQVLTLDSVMQGVVRLHKQGMEDSQVDDRRDVRNAVNSALDGVIRVQQELKYSGKIK